MTPELLLLRYQGETVRWLRGRLGLSQLYLALDLGASEGAVATWESRKHPISPRYRAQLVALLAPHLATPEGAAFARALADAGATARA